MKIWDLISLPSAPSDRTRVRRRWPVKNDQDLHQLLMQSKWGRWKSSIGWLNIIYHWSGDWSGSSLAKTTKTCGSMATVARIFGATPIRDPVICRTSWLHWATTLCCVAGICTHWRLDVWFSRLGILLLSTNVLTICTEHCDDFSQATCVETGVDQALLYVCMVDMPAHFSVGCVMIDDHCL